MNNQAQSTINDALELLRGTEPEYQFGLSNHGPMLADALISLGKAPLVVPWLEQYKTHLNFSTSVPGKPIIESDYRAALSDFDRYSDWQTYFRSQVRESDWKLVLNTWVSNLAPGFIAAAMHGVIRVGHAVRSLSYIESENTLNELADALSYWAARYQPLPEATPTTKESGCSIYDALNSLTPLPLSRRQDLGLITKEVAIVGEMPAFPAIINLLEQNEQPEKILTNLTEGFAHMFVYNAEPTQSVIEIVHALTGPYALRHMLPYLAEPVARKALRYAWQASAALYMRYGLAFPKEDRFDDASTFSQSELVEKAVATKDEHAVKFVEACLTEHKLNAHPIYLKAAATCSRLLQPAS